MIFTFIQLLIMFITVYLCVYSLIDRVLKCIEHCATAKAYGKFREAGIMTKMEAVEENIIKSTKEKDNVEKELIKNKIYAVILMCGGALAIPWCDGDATFFLFSLMMGIPLFFAKENWIYEGEEDDGTSREETYSEIRTKSENRHIQSHKRAAQYSGTRTSRKRA